MSEPLVVPVGMGLTLASGHLLGMPIDAVVIGAMASLAVLLSQEKKQASLVVSYTLIGGLLGGAFAPILGHWFVAIFSPNHAFLHDKQPDIVHVVSPALIGLTWQFMVKILAAIYPSLEKRLAELVNEAIDFVLRRPKK